MSNLTKVLIVLLTIGAIFLCGIVVTYVANADNYKQKFEKQRNEVASLEKTKDSLTEQLNDKIKQKDDTEKSLNEQIAGAKGKADELAAKIADLERQKADLEQKTNNLASITKAFSDTTEKQTQTLNSALEEVKQIKAEQIKLSKELDETSASLTEKNAIIESLQTEKRRMAEDKADLQNRMDKLLQTGGRVITPGQPVTQEKGNVTAVSPAAVSHPISLKAKIIELDAKNNLATISIGSADGVKEGYKFYVTRGDEFICVLLIIDVDTDKAVGSIDLAKQPPQVGDIAVTNL